MEFAEVSPDALIFICVDTTTFCSFVRRRDCRLDNCRLWKSIELSFYKMLLGLYWSICFSIFVSLIMIAMPIANLDFIPSTGVSSSLIKFALFFAFNSFGADCTHFTSSGSLMSYCLQTKNTSIPDCLASLARTRKYRVTSGFQPRTRSWLQFFD